MLWVRAMRASFRTELGNEYTEQMDAVWKQVNTNFECEESGL